MCFRLFLKLLFLFHTLCICNAPIIHVKCSVNDSGCVFHCSHSTHEIVYDAVQVVHIVFMEFFLVIFSTITWFLSFFHLLFHLYFVFYFILVILFLFYYVFFILVYSSCILGFFIFFYYFLYNIMQCSHCMYKEYSGLSLQHL